MLVIQRPTVEAIDEEEGNLQRFAISPLEPGFGHTLGKTIAFGSLPAAIAGAYPIISSVPVQRIRAPRLASPSTQT